MNIKTITLHCTDNCGSSLQSLALQKYLEDQGHDARIIDYTPGYLKYNGSFLKSVIKSVVMFRDVQSQNRKNRAFYRNFLRITGENYKNYAALKEAPPKADAYITGSDQLWNPSYLCGKDPAYYLDFVPAGKKKYAYAASVGKAEVPQEEKDLIVSYVKDFEAISVRENCTKQWLAPLVNCPVEHVCDPVFLKDGDYYRSIAKKPQDLGKYILVYLVQPSETLDKVLAYLRKALDAKVVLIYGARKNCDCDYHFRDVSPEEFLGYIDGAAHVVASSFHATAFSCILRKQFTVVLPQHNTVRIEDILHTAGLEQRIIRPADEIGAGMLETVDYAAAGEKLDAFIKHSKEVLNSYCEE
ncbi:MAG: polysaccharide pyruvyl transferase family protein [Oscillospiraceae bacterium]|nr:polysaccharide pyruvyl transferase family protein [Oscillospiraceae bacterium]